MGFTVYHNHVLSIISSLSTSWTQISQYPSIINTSVHRLRLGVSSRALCVISAVSVVIHTAPFITGWHRQYVNNSAVNAQGVDHGVVGFMTKANHNVGSHCRIWQVHGVLARPEPLMLKADMTSVKHTTIVPPCHYTVNIYPFSSQANFNSC